LQLYSKIKKQVPENLLTINDLHLHFPTEAGTIEVDNIPGSVPSTAE